MEDPVVQVLDPSALSQPSDLTILNEESEERQAMLPDLVSQNEVVPAKQHQPCQSPSPPQPPSIRVTVDVSVTYDDGSKQDNNEAKADEEVGNPLLQ